MDVPKTKALKKDEIINILKEEILRKDKEIEKLKAENKILLNVTYKNTKRMIESVEDDDL